ncbi:MAG: ABC transporter permease, partial [Oceanospirillum sp.]|nr:ABC transporter permease [Oceanospirillum sp.]
MFNWVQHVGHRVLTVVAGLGRSAQLLLAALLGLGYVLKNFRLLIKQVYVTGVLSIAIIGVSGLFIGMVLALQGYSILIDFGAEDALGQMVALTLLRELSPVVAALLFAGRAGSALTAEIGLMK